MLRALVESMSGVGHTIPNPAVGCILTREGTIVTTGATEKFGGRHAERVAFDNLKALGQTPEGLDVYVSLEPCSHHGRQPPCCELFAHAGVRHLHIAVGDPNPMVSGRGLDFVRQHVTSVDLGLCKNVTTAWHLPFLFQHRFGRPLLVAKWAQTLDGAFADSFGESKWITGPQSRAHGHWLRLKYDITAIGLGTLLTDHPSLSVRDCWRPNERQPDVCVLDGLGEARGDDPKLVTGLEKLAKAAVHRKVALVTTKANLQAVQSKLPTSVQVLALPEIQQNFELTVARQIRDFWSSQQLQNWLGRPAQSVFFEGGARLISALLEIDAIDLMHTFVAPVILAGQGRRLIREHVSQPHLSDAFHFDVLSTFPLGDDMLLELMPRRMVEAFFSEV